MKNILCTENLTKTYQLDEELIVAVDSVSIEINSGEFIGLVGPSGSGKTSLLAMIAGLLTPNGGKIFLAGEELGANERVAAHRLPPQAHRLHFPDQQPR